MATKSHKKKQKKQEHRGRVTERVTPAHVWKAQRRLGEPFELTVPSGNVCLVKPAPGMVAFMEQGMVPNALMPIVRKALESDADEDEGVAEKLAAETSQLLEEDQDRIIEVVHMMNAVCVDVVIKPALTPVPLDDAGIPLPLDSNDRDPQKFYVDEVDLQDRIFIFQVAVGGTADLERFRRG